MLLLLIADTGTVIIMNTRGNSLLAFLKKIIPRHPIHKIHITACLIVAVLFDRFGYCS